MTILETLFTKQAKVSKKRMEICSECEFYGKMLMNCKKCGCFLKAKTMFLYEECPIGKWNREPDGSKEDSGD